MPGIQPRWFCRLTSLLGAAFVITHLDAPRYLTMVLAFGVGTLVAVGLGVFARAHDATFFAFNVAGFSSGTAAKAWLATVAFLRQS